MANLIGQQRGNFKLTQRLGQGGFAEVYLGEHIHFQGDKVAIKVLYTHLDEKGIAQFKNEALTLKKLSHPHIIKVLDFGFDTNNNIPYLIMEYAPNDSLAYRHPIGKPLPFATVVDYVKQIADALQYAHNHNVIHRDVKPANMLISANKSILLSDFGIARVVQTYTVGTKSIAGSFEYMSPEQGKAGAGAVFASDQYSLGVVAYQWLCGNLPFQGDTIQLMAQHRMDPPPPFPTTLNIPASVESAVMKALAKDPQQRFVNVQEFAHMLEQASKGVSVQTSTSNAGVGGGTPPTQTRPSSDMDIDALYRQGVVAFANGETSQNKKALFEEAEHCWEQVLAIDPNYLNRSLKTRFTKLQDQLGLLRTQELRDQAENHHKAGQWQEAIQTWEALLKLAPNDAAAQKSIIQELRDQAENYRQTGQWQEAIQTWEALLKLAPKDAAAQKSITTARHNMQYTGMYATAQQLVQEGNVSAAKVELAELKQYAPEYGDPKNLSSTIQQKEDELERPKREAKAAQERAAADKAAQEKAVAAKAAQERAAADKAAQERAAADKAAQERAAAAKVAQERALSQARWKTFKAQLLLGCLTTILLLCVCGFVGIVTQSLVAMAIAAAFIIIIYGVWHIVLLRKPHYYIDFSDVLIAIGAPLIAFVLATLIAWGVTAIHQKWLPATSYIVFIVIAVIGIVISVRRFRN